MAAASPSLKCPTPFVSTDATTCVMPCPSEKQYVRGQSGGNYTCTYSPDPSRAAVQLVTVGATSFNGSTLEDLRTENPAKYSEFFSEQTRFEQALAIAYGSIDKQNRVQDAFYALQAAENARDKSPSAYQMARTAYYTLIKGDDWVDEEFERVSESEVGPEVQKYRDAVTAANLRNQEQQKTIDVVNGIKDKVLSLKDDFKYSVSTFSDQLEKVKIQLNMENRSRVKEERDNTWTWIDLGLNVLLVGVLVYAVFTFVRRYFIAKHNTAASMTTIRIPTYTGQVV